MLPTLIAAGVSQLSDLLRSKTQSSNNSFDVNDPNNTGTADKTSASAGASLSTDLNRFLLDVQSGSSATTATGQKPAAHAHHHHHGAYANAGAATQSPATSLTA